MLTTTALDIALTAHLTLILHGTTAFLEGASDHPFTQFLRLLGTYWTGGKIVLQCLDAIFKRIKWRPRRRRGRTEGEGKDGPPSEDR